MKSRKAQSALEYITTYGWAVLVVLILGIALWQLGIFQTSPATSFSGFGALKPQLSGTELKLSGSTANFTGMFINGFGDRVIVTDVNITEKYGGCATDITVNDNFIGPNGVVIGRGNFFVVKGTGIDTAAASVGDIYELTVRFDYNILVGGTKTNHSVSGVIRGPYV